MAKHATGKHGQPKAAIKHEKKVEKAKQQEETSSPNGALSASAQIGENFTPASLTFAEAQKQKNRVGRRIGITFLVIFILLVGSYLAGFLFFSMHFFPNTYISSMDVSYKSAEQLQTDINDAVDNYKVDVKGHGLNLTFTSKDAGISVDASKLSDAVFQSQEEWKWPVEFFYEHDATSALTDSVSADKLSEIVGGAVAEVNATATAPENAKVEYDASSLKFVIVPEVIGSQLDAEKILDEIVVKTMNLESNIVVTDEMLVQPGVLSSDLIVIEACDEANSLIKADITLILDNNKVGGVNSTQISEWVSISLDFVVSFNEEAMNVWANELAAKFNTVGASRTFTRSDGKVVTVKGGDYGWLIDNASLVAELEDWIRSGMVGSLEIPVIQSGKAFMVDVGTDWGNRYVDVDISEQHARFYGDDGSIIWESAVVTGSPTPDRATPQGVYDINSKGKNVTLVGRDNNGEVTYESPVSFWMPFKGNSVGFHDATWQSSFGGSRYRSGAGSHGCVNLPYTKAEELYGIIEVGDVVVVHE